jgi:hypothetical protein
MGWWGDEVVEKMILDGYMDACGAGRIYLFL